MANERKSSLTTIQEGWVWNAKFSEKVNPHIPEH